MIWLEMVVLTREKHKTTMLLPIGTKGDYPDLITKILMANGYQKGQVCAAGYESSRSHDIIIEWPGSAEIHSRSAANESKKLLTRGGQHFYLARGHINQKEMLDPTKRGLHKTSVLQMGTDLI